MILTPDHLDDLLDLYQRVRGRNPFADISRQDTINYLFSKDIRFGTYHNNKLVSTVSLISTRIDSIKLSSEWIMDKHCPDMNLKLQSINELYKYVEEHKYININISKTKTALRVKQQSMFNRSRPMTLKKIMIIPAGSYSGIKWIDDLYFPESPADAEYIVTIIQ